MLNSQDLRTRLPVGTLGEPLHFFTRIGSTNDFAAELAQEGAPHGTLVVAEEQTAGRGRWDRRWSTPPGTALAFSLVLRPAGMTAADLLGASALGALAVAEAFDEAGVAALIKWPNDVLLSGKKAAGILVEAEWQGEELLGLVMGIGINVHRGSAPPPEDVAFPATSLEEVTGKPHPREELLLAVLSALDRWWPHLGTEELRLAWEGRLAYRGEEVILEAREGTTQGRLIGIAKGGRLHVETEMGDRLEAGDRFRSLRPVDRSAG